MQKFDNSFTDELRNRLSLIDVIGRKIALVKKGQNYWGCCPFHNEKTPSFSVNEEKGFYHCFGCGEHGDIISFTMKTENIDFREAIKQLADMAGLKIPELNPKTREQVAVEESYFSIYEKATCAFCEKLFSPDGAYALEYVRKRGFTDDMIKKYCIGYAPKNNFISGKFSTVKQSELLATGLCRIGNYGMYDFFRDKLMFPIFNANGKVIAFSGRSLDGSEPKYINTGDTVLFHKRKTIFGFNFARDAIHRANRSIIVEGQIDAIQMQNNGFPETVAPLGTALTQDHISILCKSNRNITFCFDGDNAGQKAAVRACDIVMPFVHDNSDIKFAFVTGGKDPDEVLKTGGFDAMKKIIDSATPLVDFLWDIANKSFVVATPGGRVQAEKFLKSELEKITDKDLKKELENEYNSRKFNSWHKWKKTENTAHSIDLPDVDNITKKTLVYIVNKFPELAEQHSEFLMSLNISFDTEISNMNLDYKSAEKFLISVKLKNYLKNLEEQKKSLFDKMVKNNDVNNDEIADIDKKIQETNQKLEKL
ncbi:MAG: DNA primase, partial [Alphaproteobacteria bacterium]